MNDNNQYLIPANTKRGQLILGLFKGIDVAILSVGVVLSLTILLIISRSGSGDSLITILALIPGLVSVGLVFPFPNYHNIRIALGELINFYSNRQKFVWRGWCSSYEFKDK